MPANQARVFARLMDWGKTTPALDGALLLRLEWSLLDGSRTDGKFMFASDPIINRGQIMRDAIDALVVELNTRFPAAQYRDRDVVLWGS